MKVKKGGFIFLGLLCLVMTLSCITNTSLTVKAEDMKETDAEGLIERFVDCVNEHNIQGYIDLFAPEISREMIQYLDEYGEDEFFVESHRNIISIKEIGTESATEEKKMFEDVAVYQVVEEITYKDRIKRETCELKEGVNTHDFVMVEQGGKWYIYRVSVSDSAQAEAASLSCPSKTTIYFTKTANSNHYGVSSKSLNFNTYLKNVLPKEWIISYYNSYPAYGKASAMASKMYGWYYTAHPKWDYDPYNACMKDNSSDQNFLYSAYSDLGSPYQGYEDTILSFISTRAMVKESNNKIFEVHYHATNGSYHSGTMSASGCLSKAQDGKGYAAILHYYYDKSTYTGTSTKCKIVTY